ncbi:MAG: peptide chain release factor N(5)-glutamine methyltransferase [Gammaproteobacteria bacterium]
MAEPHAEAADIAGLLARSDALRQVSDSPELDCQLLLAEVLGCSRASLLAHPARRVEPARQQQYADLLARRRQGEPIAYLLGRKGFLDFELAVDRRVLIPRPETELLVEKTLECLAGREAEPLHLLDLGTGSGAIAIALARHSGSWQVAASDCSEASLELARHNAANLGAGQIRFVQSSWLAAFGSRQFALIVSNPPYIAADDPHLQQDGLPFEPRQALVAEQAGLAGIRDIISQSRRCLQKGGWLLLEHGFDQAAAVAALLMESGYTEIRGWQDLAGLDRVTAARMSTPE